MPNESRRGRPRNNSIPEKDFRKVKWMYKAGTSIKKLAQLYRVTPYIVTQTLYDMGTVIRSQGRPTLDEIEARSIEEKRVADLVRELTKPLGEKNESESK